MNRKINPVNYLPEHWKKSGVALTFPKLIHVQGEYSIMQMISPDVFNNFLGNCTILHHTSSPQISWQEFPKICHLWIFLTSPMRLIQSLEVPISVEECSILPLLTKRHLLTHSPPPLWKGLKHFLMGNNCERRESKNLMQCANFRPISLLNVDFQVPSNSALDCLSIRNMFFPFQCTKRRLIQWGDWILIIGHASKWSPHFMSTDAEKVFDQLDWSFMLVVLHNMGLGPNFLKWLETIYSCPTSWVRINANFFCNGTRQVYSLLFILILEPLMNKIRANPNFMALPRKGKHKN